MDRDIGSGLKLEQIVDWRAALIAGFVAGIVFLLLQMIGRAYQTGGSVWIAPRYIAAIVMGEDTLPPPATFDLGIFLVAFIVNLILSVAFGLLLAAIIHEWEFWFGVVVGALFGLALYAINYYTFSRFFPWFFPVRSWVDVLSHVVFGALAGGLYEALEVERFVLEEDHG